MINKKGLLIFVVLLLGVLYLPASTLAEIIKLKSGREIEGKIIEKTDKYIKIDFQGVILTYWLDEIENIAGVREVPRGEISENIQDSISEQEIKSFFKKIEIACNKMDINYFSQTLADDFKMIAFMGSQKMEFSREEYIKNLKEGWELNKDYNCKFEILSIKITDIEAIVEVKETEEMIFLNGQKISGESFQRIYLGKIRGIIKQKFIEGEITRL